ncbi:hypothetical protein Bca101_060434 [Brassica carinata]
MSFSKVAKLELSHSCLLSSLLFRCVCEAEDKTTRIELLQCDGLEVTEMVLERSEQLTTVIGKLLLPKLWISAELRKPHISVIFRWRLRCLILR